MFAPATSSLLETPQASYIRKISNYFQFHKNSIQKKSRRVRKEAKTAMKFVEIDIASELFRPLLCCKISAPKTLRSPLVLNSWFFTLISYVLFLCKSESSALTSSSAPNSHVRATLANTTNWPSLIMISNDSLDFLKYYSELCNTFQDAKVVS